MSSIISETLDMALAVRINNRLDSGKPVNRFFYDSSSGRMKEDPLYIELKEKESIYSDIQLTKGYQLRKGESTYWNALDEEGVSGKTSIMTIMVLRVLIQYFIVIEGHGRDKLVDYTKGFSVNELHKLVENNDMRVYLSSVGIDTTNIEAEMRQKIVDKKILFVNKQGNFVFTDFAKHYIDDIMSMIVL
jgi:hypothetical protein